MRNPDYPDIFAVPIVNNQKINSTNSEEPSTDENINSDQPAKRLKTMTNESTSGCITPCDIREAIRRFNQTKGVFTIMERCYTRPRKVISL